MQRLAGVAAVVFDFDGTLARLTIDFDAMRREVLGHLAAQGGEAAGLDALPVLELLEAAEARLAAAGRDPAPLRAAAHAAIERIELAAARRARLLPGVPSALAELRRRGYRLGIVTRNCAAAVALVLGSAGGALPHDVLLARDHVGRVKPDPAHLTAALERLGVAPPAAVMVGDHPMDIEGGRRAGMRTVGVLTGRSPREALEAAGADLVLDAAAQLPAWLPRRAGGGRPKR